MTGSMLPISFVLTAYRVFGTFKQSVRHSCHWIYTVIEEGSVHDTVIEEGRVHDTVIEEGSVNDIVIEEGSVNDTVIEEGSLLLNGNQYKSVLPIA